MRRIVALSVGGVLAALITWEILSSVLFLAVMGFWGAYPWPDKLWMWLRYAIEAPPNAIVHRWLMITGALAALPLALIACVAVKPKQKGNLSRPFGEGA